MKQVKNDSMQSLHVFLNTEKGVQRRWMRAGEMIVVPDHYMTSQLENLHNMRILRIRNI